MKKYMNIMEYYKKILGSHNLTFSELNKNSMDYFLRLNLYNSNVTISHI